MMVIGRPVGITRAERDAGAGQGQIWVLPLDGGEPTQLTKQRYGAGSPTWSPDGKTMLFTAAVGEPEEPEVEDAAIGEETKHLPRVRTITRLWHKLDGVGLSMSGARSFSLFLSRAASRTS